MNKKLENDMMMFGVPEAELEDVFGVDTNDIIDLAVYIKTLLTNSQNAIMDGNHNQARKLINCAKYYSNRIVNIQRIKEQS